MITEIVSAGVPPGLLSEGYGHGLADPPPGLSHTNTLAMARADGEVDRARNAVELPLAGTWRRWAGEPLPWPNCLS